MLAAIIHAYLKQFPREVESLDLLSAQIADEENLQTRKNFRGHITGGALVLSPDKTKILLVHHKILRKWLQPGGHVDSEDASPMAAARREVEEETGVRIARHLPVFDDPLIPIDIETHAIAANPRKNEPAHYHHDFRYVFLAARDELTPKRSEINDCEWVTFDDPKLADIANSVQKLRRFKIIP